MSAIREISIEGYKSIAAIKKLNLRALNVLIGANGSGKSNFLGAVKLLRLALLSNSELPDFVARSGGAERLLHFGSKVTPEITFDARFDDDLADWRVQMRRDDNDRLYCKFNPYDSVSGSGLIEALDKLPGIEPLLALARTRAADIGRLYHFDDAGATSPMKTTADLHDNRYLRAAGSNLAAFLFLLREKHPAAYTQIRQSVRLAAPFFDDFALQPLELNEKKILLEWRHIGSDTYFNASSLSDGSIRFIALATLLLQPESLRPSVILLDEPELGLHPYAITLLACLLKQASHSSQIIVATQSPLLLDHFEPEDVLVAERAHGTTQHGTTQLRRLASSKLAEWLEDYSLGQLWEKNELGGRPVPENSGSNSAQ